MKPESNLPVRSAASFVEEARATTVMAEAMSSRSVQEVQAALVVAKKFPRDEFMAREKIKTACQRKELAEMAEYEYSRGGTKITGPTIDLLKAIAKRWGNIEYGWQELERKKGESVIRAFAWDMETNARSEMTFSVRHWRDTKEGGYALTDERDIYEATANFASRRVRACLESVVDSDIVQTAVDECRRTLAGKNTEPLVDQLRKMCAAFLTEFAVTPEMIEKRIGNKLEAVSNNQLASLRRIYKSLKDGVGVREDYFKPERIVEDQPTPSRPQAAQAEAPAPEAEPEPAQEPEPPADIETPTAEEEPPPKPQTRRAPRPAVTIEQQAVADLADLIVKSGFTCDIFKRWGVTSGNLTAEEADTMGSLDDVPPKKAKRFLMSKTGLLQQLAAIKAGMR